MHGGILNIRGSAQSSVLHTSRAIDHFDVLKFSLAVRLGGHKQKKLIYSFLLFAFFRPHYQAEF